MSASLASIFENSDEARVALESLRWPDGPECAHCGSAEKIGRGQGKTHRANLYRCGACRRQFTVTVNTLFEGSKIPLHKWWLAVHLLGTEPQGASINELHRRLGVTYKTAWLMSQRLRETMKGRELSSLSSPPRADGAKAGPAPSRTAMLMSTLLAQGSTGARKSQGVGRRQDVTAKKRDPDSTRTAILEVACNLLAKHGHVGLSLSEVAQIAGVNRGTAYHHFKTREKLVKATTDWVSEQLYSAMYGDPAKQSERPVEQWDIADLNDRLADFALKNPELCRVWLLEVLASPDPTNDKFWREYQASAEKWSRSKFAQPHVDHEVTTVITLASHFLWPVWVQAHFKGKRDDQKLARRFTDELLRLSVYGSLPPEQYPDLVERLAAAGKSPHAARKPSRQRITRRKA